MTDANALKRLLKVAYDAGFTDGNGRWDGCQPDEYGNFEEWFLNLDLGSVVTGVAALSDARPKLYPHEVVRFEPQPAGESEFLVMRVEGGANGTFVELQDRASYERLHREPPF